MGRPTPRRHGARRSFRLSEVQADQRGAPAVSASGLRKVYGDVVALARLTLDVWPGEFFTMLGPSGSGKTTTLRLIAGFERADAGTVALDGVDVTGRPPYQRDVNTVFQDYALFPHMTVAENVAYGLMVKGAGRKERLSRADEALGALDLKLRQEMQLELQRVQREVSITFVYVTHDQEEALTMSDRIAVLSGGRIEQIGGPAEVYERPRTPFVAGFIGVSNLIQRDGHTITVRPEKISLLEEGAPDPAGVHVEPGLVKDVIYAGVLTRYVVDLDGGGELVVSRQNTEAPSSGDGLSEGRQVRLAWRPEQAFTIPSGEGT